MVKQLVQMFAGLVLIILLWRHPQAVIGFLEIVVDAASSIARALATTLKANGG